MLTLSRLLLLLPLTLVLACMPAREAVVVPVATAQVIPTTPPAFPGLGSALPAGHTAYDNDSLAGLFTALSLEMEWGARRPHLVRFESPVGVALEGPGSGRYGAFLDTFMAGLRSNARIDISRAAGAANLHVRFIDGASFDARIRTAVCLAAQGNVRWEEFSADPQGYGARALAQARHIDQMTIFIPDNAPPYLVRNCLLEEIPQALGLANDLYGLGSSSFNDDAAHLWPTKLDYLMLRLLYAPEMATGMTRREARARAFGVLARINPAGRSAPPLPSLRQRALGDWPRLIIQVFSRGASSRERRATLEKALQIVESHAPMSAQHCHTLVTAGRVLSRPDPERALGLLDLARRVCQNAHGVSDIRSARIRLERACALQRLGRNAQVIAIAESVWPVLAAHGQDERLAALYTIESDALEASSPGSARAAGLRQLAAEWSAYARGPGKRAADCRKRG